MSLRDGAYLGFVRWILMAVTCMLISYHRDRGMHRRGSQRDRDWNDLTTGQVMLTDVYCRTLSFVHNLLYHQSIYDCVQETVKGGPIHIPSQNQEMRGSLDLQLRFSLLLPIPPSQTCANMPQLNVVLGSWEAMSRGCRRLTEGGTPSVQLGMDISISDELRHFGDVVARVNSYSISHWLSKTDLDRVVTLVCECSQIWERRHLSLLGESPCNTT